MSIDPMKVFFTDFSDFWRIFCLKIGQKENFVMQMAYGDKKLLNKSF